MKQEQSDIITLKLTLEIDDWLEELPGNTLQSTVAMHRKQLESFRDHQAASIVIVESVQSLVNLLMAALNQAVTDRKKTIKSVIKQQK